MGGIFICYRRKDTDYIAGRLHRQLADHFGQDQVFRDINTIKLGSDFGERIDSFVGSCDALVAVIGDEWLSEDETGRRRIDQPRDWVRQEIASALEREILVVPVLVENARMPSEGELPPSLRKLARRNALDLTDARWDYEVDRLIEVVEEVVEAKPGAGPTRPHRLGDGPAFAAPTRSDPAPAFAVPPAPPRPEPPTPVFRPTPSSSQWESTGRDWSAPGPRYNSTFAIPSWAKVVVPVVLGGLVIATILALTLGTDDDPGLGSSPPVTGSVDSTTSPETVAPTTRPADRVINGPWMASSGRLTLIVERVEVGSTIRLHMLVRNSSREAATLPIYGYFSAVDDTGHNYPAASAEWATQFPPGDVRGTIELDSGPQPGASSMTVGFGQVFGGFDFEGGVFVEGVQLA